jgi:[protein-PII] uridylyltransferase
MNQTSVLGRYLWVFRRIVGRMQHDLFHVYTVDQHILMVLRNVRRFFIPEHAHEYPFCSQLAGSGTSPGCCTWPRSSTTWPRAAAATIPTWARMEARRFCRDHGMSQGRDTQLIEFLVQHHLTMSRIAQKEDLTDAEVIGGFARLVGTAAPAGAVPADGGRHPRHQPQGVERLEGQAAGRPVPLTLRALGGASPTWTPRSRRASRKRGRTWRCTAPCPAPKSRCGRRWR